MPIVVEAKSAQDYRQWISEQKALLAAAQDAAGKTNASGDLVQPAQIKAVRK